MKKTRSRRPLSVVAGVVLLIGIAVFVNLWNTVQSCAASGSGIFIAYPRSGSTIDSRSTFITGAAPPGTSVTCNSEPVRANAAGFFAHVIKLNRGENRFSLAISGGGGIVLSIHRPPASIPVSATDFRFKGASLEPTENIGVTAGDVLRFAARTSPASSVHVKLGSRTIPLYSAAQRAKGAPVNPGLSTAFGVAYQKGESGSPDLYMGFYKVTADDTFSTAKPVYTAVKGKKTITGSAAGSISTLRQPAMYRTRHDDTIVRTGPGTARTTPWVAGVRVSSDGYKGQWRRLEVAPGKHLWVTGEELDPEPPGSAPAESKVTTINLLSDNYGARIAVPLNQRLPYQVEQNLREGTVVLRIFGGQADTDFVTSDSDEGQVRPQDRASSRLIDFVTWKQKSDGVYELTAHLKKKHQWGFYVDYQDSTLALHVKAPPVPEAPGTLKGVTICVDPGHGGNEPGASGCNGLKEAAVNLAIALRLKDELERLGARVVMTRTSDVDVSLARRVQIAEAARVDFLISVHNNSLPDGRDPWKEHGTSSYWYHQQSVEPAKILKDGLVKDTGLRDFGSRYQNLFLCRPGSLPAVLVEVGFMIHPDEFLQLITPDFQGKVATSLADSLRSYINQAASE